jgi:YbbR domain-containing protein
MAWHPFRNIGLKIAALGLGTLLWVTVSGQQAERSVRVPLEFRKKPVSLEITGSPPETVEVWIQDASSQISRLGLGDVVAFIDLSDAQPGQQVLPLRTDQVVAPVGVEVTRVNPTTVSLALEPSKRIEVPIVATIDGQPAPGFIVTGWTVDPKTVDVIGPASRLSGLTSAVTERIAIGGAKASVTATVGVSVNDGALRLREPRTARVTVTIVPVRVK